MLLRLSIRSQPDDGVTPPDVCPHAGCGGRRFRLRQAIAKSVRGGWSEMDGARPDIAAHRTVTAHRYTCQDCGRTFRAYPAGIDRGQVPVDVKRLGAALRLLGLGYRDIGRALTVLGVPLAKSQAQAAVSAIVGDARAPGIARLFTRVGWTRGPRANAKPGADGAHAGNTTGNVGDGGRGRPDVNHGGPPAWIEIAGRKLRLWRAEDEHGRPALAIVDVDWWTRGEIDRWGRALLADLGVDVEIVADRLDEMRRDRRRDREGAMSAACEQAASEEPLGDAVGDDAALDDAAVDGATADDGAESTAGVLDGPSTAADAQGEAPTEAGAAPSTDPAPADQSPTDSAPIVGSAGRAGSRWRSPPSRMRLLRRPRWRTRPRVRRVASCGGDRAAAAPWAGIEPSRRRAWSAAACVMHAGAFACHAHDDLSAFQAIGIAPARVSRASGPLSSAQ